MIDEGDKSEPVGDKWRRKKFVESTKSRFLSVLQARAPNMSGEERKAVLAEASCHLGCRCDDCVKAKDALTKRRRHNSKLHKDVKDRTWHTDFVPVRYPGQTVGVDPSYDAIIVGDRTGYIATEDTSYATKTSANMKKAFESFSREINETPLLVCGDSGSSELRGEARVWVQEQSNGRQIGQCVRWQPYSKWLNGRCEGRYHSVKQGIRTVISRQTCPWPRRFWDKAARHVKQGINLFSGSLREVDEARFEWTVNNWAARHCRVRTE